MFKYENKRILFKKLFTPDLLFCIFTTNLNVLFHESSHHRHHAEDNGGAYCAVARSVRE